MISQAPGVPYLEAVTVCVGYDDMLDAVAPYNIPHFRRWLVVTDPQDKMTREVCRKYGIDCVLSEDGRQDGDFAKGRLVERALQHTAASGWRIHLDADVALPAHFSFMLSLADLQKDTIYGADRVMVKSYESWLDLLKTGYMQGGQYGYAHAVTFPPGYQVANRWAGSHTGYVPIGFFQLWHSTEDEWRGIRVKPYPQVHGNACRSDVQHALQWDRRKRALLPEVIVVHLESEPAPKGVNWQGRQTKRFGPPRTPPPPDLGSGARQPFRYDNAKEGERTMS